MGRNAQKRLAKKLRDDGPGASRGLTGAKKAIDASSSASHGAHGRRVAGPPWLTTTIASKALAVSPDDAHGTSFLDVSLAAARGASLDEIARSLAAKLPAEEVLLELDGLSATTAGARGLAKRSGQEAVPGIEVLVSSGLVPSDAPFVVDNVPSDPRLPLAMGARARIGSIAAVSLVFAGARRGFLAVGRREVAAFPSRDVDALLSLSTTLAEDLVQASALRLGFTDPLTGTLSRQALVVLLERELERARRDGSPCAVALIDLDGLRGLNETHGRTAGDRALVDLATRAIAATRGGELFGRLGADKFLVVLRAEASDVESALRRLLDDLLERPLDVGTTTVSLRASVGTTSLEPQEDTVTLLGRAERALAAAKAAGGATLVVIDGEDGDGSDDEEEAV